MRRWSAGAGHDGAASAGDGVQGTPDPGDVPGLQSFVDVVDHQRAGVGGERQRAGEQGLLRGVQVDQQRVARRVDAEQPQRRGHLGAGGRARRGDAALDDQLPDAQALVEIDGGAGAGDRDELADRGGAHRQAVAADTELPGDQPQAPGEREQQRAAPGAGRPGHGDQVAWLCLQVDRFEGGAERTARRDAPGDDPDTGCAGHWPPRAARAAGWRHRRVAAVLLSARVACDPRCRERGGAAQPPAAPWRAR